MSKIAISILFAASLLASGCTVHHHHYAPGKSAKKGHHGMRGDGHKGCACSRRLPKGHPPVGDGMKGHRMDPHHGMKGRGMDPHHGMPDTPMSPAPSGGHESMQGMPAPVQSLHDAFAAVWHLESDEERKTTACNEVGNWKDLLAAVKDYKVEGEGAALYASAADDMSKKTEAVQVACKRKKGDVQAALKDAHEALHKLFAAVTPAS